MKNNFLFVLVGIVAMLTSCNKEEVGGLATNKTTSFNVSVDGGVQTRAIAVNDLTRFVMEVYEGAIATGTPVKHIEQSTGLFNDVLLKDKQMYTVVFWADYGTPGTATENNINNEYNASNLQAARVADGKQPSKAAYSGVSRFTVGTDVEAVYTKVTLTHSVAQVNFIQTEALTTAINELAVSYSQSFSVNVGDSTVTPISGEIKHTFNYNKTVADTLGTSYIIAAKGASRTLLEITATLNNETPKVVSNVPFERNFRTNISGPYSSKYAANLMVTCDDDWGIPDNNATFPKVKVGDFYYKDKTFSSTYTADPLNPCIGIVFVVNADGCNTGKIVSLDEATNIKWSTESVDTGAYSETDGAANTDKIFALSNYNANVYPAFGWCATKNTPATAGITWYLPATEELRQLYAAMSGLKWVASGAGAGEVNDWVGDPEMPNYNTYIADRTAFNNKFTTANGTPMDLTGTTKYHSSIERVANTVANVNFLSGGMGHGEKNVDHSVRAVSTF